MKQRTTFGLAIAIALSALLPINSFARQGTPPVSHSAKVKGLQSIPQITVPATDRAAELAADNRAARRSPVRIAVPANVLADPLSHGTWEIVPGGRIWRLRIQSAGATDLNLTFSTCWLPDGATLHISSEDEDYFQGPYTSRDNKEHGQLWTPVVPGSRAVIELFVPSTATEEPRLLLSRINCGYRDMFRRRKDFSDAKDLGGCSIDVACPEGNPWRNEIRSVAVYTVDGIYQCSGTLLNNVSNNFRNFFLTAAHCGVNSANAASVVVYWNFESPACGQRSGGSLSQNQNGAIFRMAKNDVDFTLIELDDIPNSSFHVYYAGWDRTNSAINGAVGIHHPNSDEKSLSFSTSPLTNSDNCIGVGSLTHWSVLWNSGVTEGGSSGSGIWDPITHRLIGVLSGGDSSCAFPQGIDCYGKFSVAWASGNNSSTRLRDWLDPGNSGRTSISGREPNPIPQIFAAGTQLISESCVASNGVVDPGETVTVRFALQNFGGTNSVNLIATLLATNGITSPGAPQSYGTVTNNGQVVARNFSFTANGTCGDVITARLALQDGTNNRGTLSYSFQLGTPTITFTQNFDGVLNPGLPANWVKQSSNSIGWFTTNSFWNSPSNSAHAINYTNTSDAMLISPSIPIGNTNAQLIFRHYVDTEDDFDGGVLEISYNTGPFNDILAAGGSFASGGYNAVLPTGYGNPLATRNAWSKKTGGFLTTVVNLPVTAAGQNIRFRWRLGTDESVGYPEHKGWYVDSVSISDGRTCCSGLVPPQIVETRQTNGSIVFSFNTIAGVTYITESRGGTGTNFPWQPLQTNAGTGSKRSVTNSLSGATNRFFRVKAQ